MLRVSQPLRHHKHEFVEGNHSVAVVVDHVDELLGLLVRRSVAQLPEKGLEFTRFYHTVAILVKSIEGLVQSFNF